MPNIINKKKYKEDSDFRPAKRNRGLGLERLVVTPDSKDDFDLRPHINPDRLKPSSSISLGSVMKPLLATLLLGAAYGYYKSRNRGVPLSNPVPQVPVPSSETDRMITPSEYIPPEVVAMKKQRRYNTQPGMPHLY